MSDYIKREDALSAVKHAWAKGLEPSQYIEIIPAADVKEVQHGKWEYIGTDKKGYVYRCSNCAGRIGLDYETNYCPNCGAKMDLED